MTATVKRIEALPGPTGSVPFNESNYSANAAFWSWGGRAKGGWIVTGDIDVTPISDGAEAAREISVPGVELGDYVEVAFGFNHAEVTITTYVTAAGTVEFHFLNESGGSVNLAPSTFICRITDLT